MAALPTPVRLKVLDAIDAWRVGGADQSPRTHLGASTIGTRCERALWYKFRWVGRETFDARMLRLFDRGQREEATFVEELRGAGIEVLDVDPSTGRQFSFKAAGGHFGGSLDGVALGIPDAPQTWHVLEFKTHSAKSFGELAKKGVKLAKPLHYAQMQAYMHMGSLTRALYLAVNKDTDEVYGERIRYEPDVGKALMEKAERVVFASEPLPGVSTDPAWYECKFCPAAKVCHGQQMPEVSCRSCLHSTPEKDGTWSCSKDGGEDRCMADQLIACPDHLFIPALLRNHGEPVDASMEGNWVEYQRKDGSKFRNVGNGAMVDA
jgi:hypothetical protein